MSSMVTRSVYGLLCSAVAALVVCGGPGRVLAAADEFRAMWVSRFEWPNTDEATCKATIDTIMQKLKANNFNAVIFQMRGQADTLYPSPYEPWSPLISPTGADPGWDPMAYAINKAHENGLEFHAYINHAVCWNSSSPPSYAPSHLFWQHCNVNDPAHRDWLICDEAGTPTGFVSEYVWIAPGIPDFQAYWRKQVMYVVQRYDGSAPDRPAVDGVHFDRIRTPGPSYSHDPISEARRLSGETGANPANLSFGDWTADQITRTLCDLYAQINEYTQNISPTHHRVKVSSAPLGLYLQERYPGYPSTYLYGRSKCYQDAQAWLAAGAQDFIVPQIYWADEPWRTTTPHFSEVLPDWLLHNSGRHVYPGCNVSATGPGLLSEVSVTRTKVAEIGQGNAPGDVVWSYSGFNNNNYWSLYSGAGGPYEQPASVPAMPWKDSPTDGIILGTVSDGTNPVVDAQVRRTGLDYVALSSADGVYSFLKVPPGTYTLTFIKPAVGGASRVVSVAAGQVVRVPEVVLTPNDPPIITDVQAGGITDNAATITWTTDTAADSQVEYGTTIGYGSSSVLDPSPVTWHSVTLSGLTPNTLYHYRVRSANGAGTSYSGDYTFTTAVFSGEIIVDNTDEGFSYLLTPADGWNIGTASSKYGINYFWCYEAAGTDEASATAKARWTPVLPVTGTWDIYIWYARGTNRSTNTYWKIVNAGPVQNLRVNQEINGNGWTLLAADVPLRAGTESNVQMWNNTGITGTNQVVQGDAVRFVFKAGDSQAPSVPANVAAVAITAHSVQLAWDVSTDDFGVSGYNVYRDGVFVGETATNSYLDGGLTAGTTYSYQVTAFDATPNESARSAALIVKTLSLAAGDFDQDGDVDLNDFAVFQTCFRGPNQPIAHPECDGADLDGDQDVDLTDFAAFQACHNGPNRPASTACQ